MFSLCSNDDPNTRLLIGMTKSRLLKMCSIGAICSRMCHYRYGYPCLCTQHCNNLTTHEPSEVVVARAHVLYSLWRRNYCWPASRNMVYTITRSNFVLLVSMHVYYTNSWYRYSEYVSSCILATLSQDCDIKHTCTLYTMKKIFQTVIFFYSPWPRKGSG